MAKKSKMVANERRRQTVARYAERRAALKEAIRTAATAEERDIAVRALKPAAPRRQPGAGPQPRPDRRTPPRSRRQGRTLPYPAARAGPPRTPSRHHQVLLVTSSTSSRPRARTASHARRSNP